MAQALTQLGRLGGVVAVGAYILPHIIYDGAHLKLKDFFNALCQSEHVKPAVRTLGAPHITVFSVLLSVPPCFAVDGGERAVMYDARRGILPECIGEGTHFKIPYFQVCTRGEALCVSPRGVADSGVCACLQQQHIMSVRAEPKEIKSRTGTKDLQMVQIALRVLSRPKVRLTCYNDVPPRTLRTSHAAFLSAACVKPCTFLQEDRLPEIFTKLGANFNDRILPSVGNEVLKATVAKYNAEELLSKRSVISLEIKQELEKRANTFGLELVDVAITVTEAASKLFNLRVPGPPSRVAPSSCGVSRACSIWCLGRSSQRRLKPSKWPSRRPSGSSGWSKKRTRSGRRR